MSQPLIETIALLCHENKMDVDNCVDILAPILSRPFAMQIRLKILDEKKLNTEQLEMAIGTAAYMNENSQYLIAELLWKLGSDRKETEKYFASEYDEKKNLYFFLKNCNYDGDRKIVYQELYKLIKNSRVVPEQICVRFVDIDIFMCIACENYRLLEHVHENYDVEKIKQFGRTSETVFSEKMLDTKQKLDEMWPAVSHSVQQTALLFCALNKNVKCFKILAKYGYCSDDPHICSMITLSEGLEMLKLAHECKYPWTADVCTHAALTGNLGCLKYAHENGCEWTSDTVSYGSQEGNLECVKYAHMHGCEWGKYPCEDAIGHLECLKFAVESGCKYTRYEYTIALEDGFHESAQYLLSLGFPDENEDE